MAGAVWLRGETRRGTWPGSGIKVSTGGRHFEQLEEYLKKLCKTSFGPFFEPSQPYRLNGAFRLMLHPSQCRVYRPSADAQSLPATPSPHQRLLQAPQRA